MKKLLTSISIALVSAGVAVANAAEASATVAQFHFMGMQNLSANTNAAKLNKIWNLPETTKLRAAVSQKLAMASEQIFPQTLKGKASNLQPLFDDLLLNESVIELVEGTNHQLQLNIAAQLDEKRSSFWESNLLTATSSKSGNAKNWSVKLSAETALNFVREGKWTCLAVGNQGTKDFVSRLGKTTISLGKTNWLAGEINWSLAERSIGISIPFKISQSKITISGKADNLFTTVESQSSQKIDWKRETWKTPSIIREPVISFTAAQPVAGLCKPSQFFEQVGFNPLSRQIFCWSEADLPFQTFCSIATTDPTNELKSISTRLIAAADPILAKRQSGRLIWDGEQHGLLWTNIPLMSPSLRPYFDGTNRYILGGLYPYPARRSPPASQLFRHIEENPKLLYYDWEITENRIGHWDMLTRVVPVFSPEALTPGHPLRITRNSKLPAHIWLRAIASLLGNTVTEVTISGQDQLTLRRKSNLGFTGMELTYFVGLMDHPDFPFIRSGAPVPK